MRNANATSAAQWDLGLDPTCGSGTTAYVTEQWWRRWITCDTSRVPLALARQRLLTATFDYYEINAGGAAAKAPEAWRTPKASPGRASVLECGSPLPLSSATLPNNPGAGFVYRRRKNPKGEEVGGIVPHITLKSIANMQATMDLQMGDLPKNMRSSQIFSVEFEDSVWDHLAGTTSAPFPAGEHGQIAVKVFDTAARHSGCGTHRLCDCAWYGFSTDLELPPHQQRSDLAAPWGGRRRRRLHAPGALRAPGVAGSLEA